MFDIGSPVHVWIPNQSTERVLIPGTVEQSLGGGSVVVARFSDLAALEPGTEVQLFAEFRRKFFQQGATVRAIASADESETPSDLASTSDGAASPTVPLIAFERFGDPVSAEGRGSYRVGTALAQLHAKIGDSQKSARAVVDVSPEGFAVLLPQAPTIGTNLAFEWAYAGVAVQGRARVQTVKQTRGGALRVGLLVADSKAPARKALEKISSALQRDQLKRQVRAA
jgi:hypothetical protein